MTADLDFLGSNNERPNYQKDNYLRFEQMVYARHYVIDKSLKCFRPCGSQKKTNLL
ncbi:hypothetical protein ES707_05636 [subsurface metagenome]